MHKRYIYILRGKLHVYPPCISHIYMLSKYIDEVIVICSDCDINILNELKKIGTRVILIGDKRLTKGILGKISSYIYFRKRVIKILKKEFKANTVLWFGTADSAFSLLGRLNGKDYIVSSLELYDKNFLYRNGLALVVKNARSLVVCEYNRAYIMKCWWNLKNVPYIMPNKPYFHPQKRNMICEQPDIKDIICQIQGTKVIIFQGLIMWSHKHLQTIAQALADIGEDYTFVLMGNVDEKLYNTIKSIYQRTINVKYIPAPNHLIITSYAYIGVVTYDETSLNNLYCALNKIYEYAGFGIPMLCSNIPGLKYTIEYNNAGICTNLQDIKEVKNAIKEIEKNYEKYSRNSKEFFDKTDNTLILKKIINEG